MLEKRVTVRTESGLHARPAAQFVKLASSFRSDVRLEYKGRSMNGKSIIELMMGAASQGEDVVLKVSGPDEYEALSTLEDFLTKGPESA